VVGGPRRRTGGSRAGQGRPGRTTAREAGEARPSGLVAQLMRDGLESWRRACWRECARASEGGGWRVGQRGGRRLALALWRGALRAERWGQVCMRAWRAGRVGLQAVAWCAAVGKRCG
jgi:hypothetical protein